HRLHKRSRLTPATPATTSQKQEQTSLAHQAPQEILEAQTPETSEVELGGNVVKRLLLPAFPTNNGVSMVTTLTHPESLAAEEYRRLCFNVEWGLKETLSGPCKTLMVTSALPYEGKTITAVNLASTLARNHTVLLIDANFRKPAVHQAFGIPPEYGFSDLIEHQTIPHLFVPTERPNLSILPAGLTLGHPADLLSSQHMQQFLDALKTSSSFEYAIFDVPPASVIPDASILASKLDGIVWIIWELKTSKDLVRQALTRITNPAILGVVLNYSEQRTLPRKYDKIWKSYRHDAQKLQHRTSPMNPPT
ncbi:polysaccharide biosynthesis tyrosine autokinase, partial [candidate division KSB3 bacterium]|nr:polysaccharide biosynthesis tyrosine autokinase [candidate division KSB3 bacterium]MBD3323166.1 polysaccharide biosynthesis tyrosine autokinase [candidate division KSB3 bacterium]